MRAPTPTPVARLDPIERPALWRSTEEQRRLWAARGGIGGRLDRASMDEVLTAVASCPEVTRRTPRQQRAVAKTTKAILGWLASQAGAGWQERWESANPDDTTDWIDRISTDDPGQPAHKRVLYLDALVCLMLVRSIVPSHRFIRTLRSKNLYTGARATFRPDLFARVEQRAEELGLRSYQHVQAVNTLTALVLHSGRDLDELTFDDFMTLRHATGRPGGQTRGGISMGWDLVRGIAQIPDAPFHTMRAPGQLSTEELVDGHKLACRPVRDVIVRYLNERRPALDYSTFSTHARILSAFWADLEAHHPGIDSLHLSDDVAEAWRQRTRYVIERDGTVRERLSSLNIFVPVRAFYLDIAAWALEDPSWAPWAVPCPVRRADTEGYMKNKRRVTARMHQRVRDRLPHLMRLVDTTEHHLRRQTELLAAAHATRRLSRVSWNLRWRSPA